MSSHHLSSVTDREREQRSLYADQWAQPVPTAFPGNDIITPGRQEKDNLDDS